MTSVWVAEHGRCYPNAAIDCRTRAIIRCPLELRCRAREAAALIDAAVAQRGVAAEPTLATDNGSALTSRAFRARPAEQGIIDRRGGHHDPDSQTLIESRSSKLKQRRTRREQFKTRHQAPNKIGAHADRNHHRPHSRLNNKPWQSHPFW